jgi:hypothetical protein
MGLCILGERGYASKNRIEKIYSKSTIKRNLLLRVDVSLLFFVSSHDFRAFRLIDTSTAPNPGLQDRVKSAAQYQPLPTGRQAEPLGCTRGLEFVERQTPGFRPGIVEGLILKSEH